MSRYLFHLSVLIALAVMGCSKNNPVTPKTPNPPGNDTTLVYMTIRLGGLQYPRTGEHYILWIKTKKDTSWNKLMQLDTLKLVSDSLVIVGKFSLTFSPDSISDAMVTLQPANRAALIMDFPILEAHNNFKYDTATKTTISTFVSKDILGDYSALSGGLVFTSKMTDSMAYTHEFYLMNFTDSVQTPSLMALNPPPKGWDYALWAIDSAFTPHQNFLYGLFSSAAGRLSDSANDYYPFPGGWKRQQMNVGSGSIIVTLEPRFYGDSLKFKGPSPFTLLSFNRINLIEKNKNYPMTNVSSQAIPNGEIIFYRY